jgi:mRNA-degrading endonuclease RelE of RelBE toxin-antitoxin system
MAWTLVEREQYVRLCDEGNISEEVREQIRAWAPTLQNNHELPRQKKIFWTARHRFEVWSVGIPNPDANKGKSGGYRLILFLDLNEETINLDFIETRKELGYKEEGHRKKDGYNAYITSLKEALSKKECGG